MSKSDKPIEIGKPYISHRGKNYKVLEILEEQGFVVLETLSRGKKYLAKMDTFHDFFVRAGL